jgi:hypothetical protein
MRTKTRGVNLHRDGGAAGQIDMFATIDGYDGQPMPANLVGSSGEGEQTGAGEVVAEGVAAEPVGTVGEVENLAANDTATPHVPRTILLVERGRAPASTSPSSRRSTGKSE